MAMLLKSYGLLAKESDTFFLLFTLCFFIKVFMSSLRLVDIVPLRGTGAKPELGAANCSQLPHVFIAQVMPVRSI
jgi:hypothetical protein